MFKKSLLVLSFVGSFNFSCLAMIPQGQADYGNNTLEHIRVEGSIILETHPEDDPSTLNVTQDVDFIANNTTDPYSLMTAIKQLSEDHEIVLSSTILKMALKKTDLSLEKLKSPNDSTVLHFAVKSNEENVVKIIFGALDKPNLLELLSCKDNLGRTPCDLASDQIKQIMETYGLLAEWNIEHSLLTSQSPQTKHSLCPLF